MGFQVVLPEDRRQVDASGSSTDAGARPIASNLREGSVTWTEQKSAPNPKIFERRSTYDAVADQLRDLIVQGAIKPGEFIDETALVRQFGVSRTPIREALKVLSFEGLVKIVPNKGSYAATLTGEDARQLIEVLAELEGFAASLACDRATRADILALRRLHEDALYAFESADRLAYSKINLRFHSCIVDGARNAFLTETHQAYTNRLRRARHIANPTQADWQKSMDEHEKIIAAIAEGNQDAARTLIRNHIAGIYPAILPNLDAE